MKSCAYCGAEFAKRPRESWAEWDARVVCSRSCRPSLHVRLWSRIDTTAGPDGCWPWLGVVNLTGHGGIRVNDGTGKGRSRGVHRVVYEAEHGPLPVGIEVHHACGTPACCNVAHMVAIPKAEHSRISDGGAYNRAKTHCPAGHPYEGDNLYTPGDGRRQCRECNRAACRRYAARRRAAKP